MLTNLFYSDSRGCPGISVIVLALLINCVFTVAVNFAEASVQVQVTVEGVDGAMRENVLAYLILERQKSHPDLTSDLVEKLHKKAPEGFRRFFIAAGKYSSTGVMMHNERHGTNPVYLPLIAETVRFCETSRSKMNDE